MNQEEYCNREAIRDLASMSPRGVPLCHLVAYLQDCHWRLQERAYYFTKPHDFPGSQEDYDKLQDFFWECRISTILQDLKRRKAIRERGELPPNAVSLQAIKEVLSVEDVLGQYVEVFYTNRERMKFRCTLHGEDRNPSGVIYTREKRWHCFGCSASGDIFDAVMAFGRLSFGEAVRKLAADAGIDTQLMPKKRTKVSEIKIPEEYRGEV